MSDVVFSRRQAVTVRFDEGLPSERSYQVAPLTMLERQQFRRDMVAGGALYPGPLRMREALRDALRELAPANLADLLATLDACDAVEDAGEPFTPQQARDREVVVFGAMRVPHYATLRAAEQYYWDLMPHMIVRRALRGWSGPDLPSFARVSGEVPEDVLAALPEGDIPTLGWRAYNLAFLPASAGNVSGAPSPSPDPQTDTTAA